MTDQVKHLLGGYATGTLTAEENAALMQAALEDQELFNALSDDEALRSYLADANFRKDLLKATAPKPTRLRWITALSTAAACMLAALLWTTQPWADHRTKPPAAEIALTRPPAITPPPVSAPPKQAVLTPRAAPRRAEKQPAPPAAPEIAPQSNADALSRSENSAVMALPPAGLAGGAFAPRSVQPLISARPGVITKTPITAQITDVNAAILTLDAGSKTGIRIGDRLEVLHDGSPIGFLTITTAELDFSVGTYVGAKSPVIGDNAVTPKK